MIIVDLRNNTHESALVWHSTRAREKKFHILFTFFHICATQSASLPICCRGHVSCARFRSVAVRVRLDSTKEFYHGQEGKEERQEEGIQEGVKALIWKLFSSNRLVIDQV